MGGLWGLIPPHLLLPMLLAPFPQVLQSAFVVDGLVEKDLQSGPCPWLGLFPPPKRGHASLTPGPSPTVVSGALDRLSDGDESAIYFDQHIKRWRYRLRQKLAVRGFFFYVQYH